LPFRDARAHLTDIRESIENIDTFLKGMGFDAYRADLKTRSAVERQLQIISEAAARLRDDGERLCPRIDWQGLRGMETFSDTAITRWKTESYGTQ
jgi:uncharacterized protein with HEPN domain